MLEHRCKWVDPDPTSHKHCVIHLHQLLNRRPVRSVQIHLKSSCRECSSSVVEGNQTSKCNRFTAQNNTEERGDETQQKGTKLSLFRANDEFRTFSLSFVLALLSVGPSVETVNFKANKLEKLAVLSSYRLLRESLGFMTLWCEPFPSAGVATARRAPCLFRRVLYVSKRRFVQFPADLICSHNSPEKIQFCILLQLKRPRQKPKPETTSLNRI